jgi:hypothetical protein
MTKSTGELAAVQRSNQMWGKRPDMIVRGRVPFNAEPPAAVLADGEITALDAFYSRNHGPFPDIAPEQWRLTSTARSAGHGLQHPHHYTRATRSNASDDQRD